MKLITYSQVLGKINLYLRKNVKDQSPNILRLWATQCEFVFAQQLRRSQQIFALYAKIWEERALRELLRRFRGQVQHHAKSFLLSSVTLLAFDWDKERIEYDDVKDYFDDFSFLERLQKETIICPRCQRRKEINGQIEGIRYCICPSNVTDMLTKQQNEFTVWEPYIEQKSMIIWRREIKPGLYAYKVYVEYPDITADDFLHVQTDVEYRKKWDNTAVSLEIIDEDMSNGSNSHVIYWEMLWPKLFANRDYVYNRRYFVDRSKKIIVIVNKSVQHPKCPVKANNQRVNEYWSFMVIKPTTNFNKAGVSFILTYFDNPGLSIPRYVVNWVAKKQMPDFLHQLHKATIEYAAAKKHNETRIVEFWDKHRDPGFEYPPDWLPGFSSEDYEDAQNENDNNVSLQEANQTSQPTSDDAILCDDQPIDNVEQSIKTDLLVPSQAVGSTSQGTSAQEDCTGQKTSWWSYLYSYLYFI
ncbi:stAR-related lipid transfer protein 7, mitochondrial isoform X1 [Malaya genurostris]|uniref:stAR-related lipid transfer protein 7, mitochondrial isoform X1 n=1 Tax=Malaya genurostris TaxID=325434 RepID=UPI0026F406D9|nr:stAR-related lipid transfer protein 7, mitochondrial isoform X1 [Malaya genurostris]